MLVVTHLSTRLYVDTYLSTGLHVDTLLSPFLHAFPYKKAVSLIFITTKFQNLIILNCALQLWEVNFAPVTWTAWVNGTTASTVLGSRQKSNSVAAQPLSSTAARRGSRWSQRIPPGKSSYTKIHECRATERLRWSRGSVLDFGTQVHGFKPGRSRRIFQGDKILNTPSFGREVKPFVPCRRFTACKRSLNVT